jgi:transcription initiation factor TFIIB
MISNLFVIIFGLIQFTMESKINVDEILSQFRNADIDKDTTNQKKTLKLKTYEGGDLYECPQCHNQGLFVDEGVVICRQCNHEYGGLIDSTAEWRSYNVDDNRTSDPTRCGTSINPLLPESSYGSTLGYSKNMYFNHLKQLNNWQSMPYHERSLKLVFDRLSQNGYNNGLTQSIIDFSHTLFAEVSKQQTTDNEGETKLSRGDIRDGLIAACLFYACKEHEVSRSPQEIGKICGVESSDVTRGINLFYKLMKDNKMINLNRYITRYSDFIDRYCNNLGIDSLVTSEIMTLGKKVDDLKILTKNTPQAMACGCIFFIATMYNLGITKTNIAEKCGISVPTVTKSYERLLPYTQKLI